MVPVPKQMERLRAIEKELTVKPLRAAADKIRRERKSLVQQILSAVEELKREEPRTFKNHTLDTTEAPVSREIVNIYRTCRPKKSTTVHTGVVMSVHVDRTGANNHLVKIRLFGRLPVDHQFANDLADKLRHLNPKIQYERSD